MSLQTFETSHEDLIHDVSYDFYGRRLVTCSSDQKLKVWDFNQETNDWELNDSWKVCIHTYVLPVAYIIYIYICIYL